MINIDEVFVANGIAILMMIFLLDCRQKNRESLHTDDKIYEARRPDTARQNTAREKSSG